MIPAVLPTAGLADSSNSTAIVSICLSACNHEYLADWLRLLRGPATGGWRGPVVIVADERNAAAISGLDRSARIAFVSSSTFPRVTVPKQPPFTAKAAGLTAEQLVPLLQHMGAAMMKTRLLEHPALQSYETVLYLDIDLWALHSTGQWIESKLRNVSHIGMAGDQTNAFCTNAMLLRRTNATAACLREWRGQMESNLQLVQEATNRGQMTACGGRKAWSLSTHPCFKDQYALDLALGRSPGADLALSKPQGGACARAITRLPLPVLRWRSNYEVQQVELRTLLKEPSAEVHKPMPTLPPQYPQGYDPEAPHSIPPCLRSRVQRCASLSPSPR